MTFTRWTRPRPESVTTYSGVLINLDEAHLHSHAYRSGQQQQDEEDTPTTTKDGGDDEGTSMLQLESTPEYTIDNLRKEVRRGNGEKKKLTAYEMKSKLINKAIQDIGMGTYNWQLFVLCGFGWFADNLWMQGVSLTLPSLSVEFGVSEKEVRYTTSALFVGLCLGSFFWGVGADVLGRRVAFNVTLLITGLFGIASAWATSWGWVCLLFGGLGFGVGGNLPVDGALFLEFLPESESRLLTLLSVWWPVGQLCSSLLAWGFIANWEAERGWRLFVFTMGVVTLGMFVVRCFVFGLLESPKFLLSQGRQAEAVGVVHGIAWRNGRRTWLTEEILDAVVEGAGAGAGSRVGRRVPVGGVFRNRLSSFSGERLRPLFNTRKLGVATVLVWFVWATIGMGYPLFNAFLPQYLSHGGETSSTDPNSPSPAITGETYRNYAITSIVGVPGSLLAAYTVDMKSPFLGRRGTLAISTLLSAIFLFFFVRFGKSPTSQLVFSCVEAFTQNIMYGVLYAFTPEIFPAPVRGAGTGVASFLNRATGLVAPVIAANMPGDGATVTIYLSAALILAAFGGICGIPIETRGRQRL